MSAADRTLIYFLLFLKFYVSVTIVSHFLLMSSDMK